MSVPTWSGRKVTEARRALADRTEWPTTCARCPTALNRGDAWNLGHRVPRWERPDLTWQPSNWQVECRPCSRRQRAGRGGRQGPSRRAGRARDLSDRDDPRTVAAPSLHSLRGPGAAPGGPIEPALGPPSPDGPVVVPRAPQGAGGRLRADRHDAPAPPGDGHLRPPGRALDRGAVRHPAAVVAAARDHAAARAPRRRHAVLPRGHRVGPAADREVGAAPRGLALWRMALGPTLFGELQTVVHTGSDIAICREVQRGAWRWAEDVAGLDGQPRPTARRPSRPPDGDRGWSGRRTRSTATTAVLGLVDEGWDVEARHGRRGPGAAALERSSPQLHLTSTAHRARDVADARPAWPDALTVDDGRDAAAAVGRAPAVATPATPRRGGRRRRTGPRTARRDDRREVREGAGRRGRPRGRRPGPDGRLHRPVPQHLAAAEPATADAATQVVDAEAWAELARCRPRAHAGRRGDRVVVRRRRVSLALAWRTTSGSWSPSPTTATWPPRWPPLEPPGYQRHA